MASVSIGYIVKEMGSLTSEPVIYEDNSEGLQCLERGRTKLAAL